MSIYPDHKTFRQNIENVAYRLEQGMYEGTYNHQDSCKCVIGLALEDYIGDTVSCGETGELLTSINDPRLHHLFTTWNMSDVRDQDEGAAKARKYLSETADLETV